MSFKDSSESSILYIRPLNSVRTNPGDMALENERFWKMSKPGEEGRSYNGPRKTCNKSVLEQQIVTAAQLLYTIINYSHSLHLIHSIATHIEQVMIHKDTILPVTCYLYISLRPGLYPNF